MRKILAWSDIVKATHDTGTRTLLVEHKGTSKNPIFVTILRYSKKLSLTYQLYAALKFLLAPCLV
ncbi:hypothetical protein NTGBS_100005 [Candidatus Nitrotoga sp. BS]|nr:hypothetical protein NTGBS_100005 [Candidatus Nitrotoga sp. BS]